MKPKECKLIVKSFTTEKVLLEENTPSITSAKRLVKERFYNMWVEVTILDMDGSTILHKYF